MGVTPEISTGNGIGYFPVKVLLDANLDLRTVQEKKKGKSMHKVILVEES